MSAKTIAGCLTLAAILGVGLVAVNENAWVFPSETSLNSRDALERASGPSNLCEGLNGIPTGGDPGWVRVNGSPDPRTPFVEARGQVLPDASGRTNPFVTHTDAPFNHYSHDLNVFLTLDAGYRDLLASGNFEAAEENQHGQIEIEWERGGIPMFAYPSPSDRLTVWGVWVWDCGHGAEEVGFSHTPGEVFPDAYAIPPFYSTEIHPPVGWVVYRNTANIADRDQAPREAKRTQDPWIWYESDDWNGIGATVASGGSGLVQTPVQATVADAFFSSFGGNIPEALNGCDDSTAISDGTTDATCYAAIAEASFEWALPLLQQDYSFFIPAPPKPANTATLVWEAENRCNEVPSDPGNPPGDNVEDVSEADDGAENIGGPACNTIPETVEVTQENGQTGIRVTLLAATSGVSYPSNSYITFAKRYKVAWDYVPPEAERINTYQVDFNTLAVYDDTDDVGDGEWVLSLRVNEGWIHPVRGHGDDDDPFWANGAVGSGTDYSIGASLTVSPALGEGLRVWARGWDDDTTFIQDNDVNEVLPLVNVALFGETLAAITPGTSHQFSHGLANPDVEGAFKVRYTVHNITKPSPSPGFLFVAGPQYGPNPQTGGRVRVSPKTLIQLVESNGVRIEYRFWKLGSSFVSPWSYGSDTSRWRVNIGGHFGGVLGFPDGVYAVQYAPISDLGIVGGRRFIEFEVDSTPPTLGVPSALRLPATGPTGRSVMWTYTALDTMPGPVTASCDHTPGSFFPIKQTTVVTCRAADAAGNETVKSFNVEVYSPFGYPADFVALGREWVEVGSDSVVETGNVGAFTVSNGPPGFADFELTVGRRTVLGGASVLSAKPKLAAQSIQLQQDVRAWETYYVDQIDVGQGVSHEPLAGYTPLFPGMPVFPLFGASGVDVHVTSTRTLGPGHYRRLQVDAGATVILSNGGNYYFTEIELGKKAVLNFTGLGTARVHITGRVSADDGARIGGGAPAQRLILYVAGADGAGAAHAFEGGKEVTLFASIYASNGGLAIGMESTATGAFIGRRVMIGDRVTLRHQKGAFDFSYP